MQLFVRSLGDPISNVAVVDLLPGGFEIVGSSLQPGAGSAGWDFVEVREDRTVFFGEVGSGARVITYQIKATAAGHYTVPPAFAESMYDRGTHACDVAGSIEVSAR